MSIGRATLPEEFQDTLSQELLIQPQPQFLHARIILGAVDAELTNMAMLGLPIPGRDMPASGAPYLRLEDVQLNLEPNTPYIDSIRVARDWMTQGPLPAGHTVRFNRPKFNSTTYTFQSREVPSGSVISTQPINVGSEQVPLTIKRFAGPYDPAQGKVAPLGIERFDVRRMVHNPSTIRDLHLGYDFHQTVDYFGVTLFDSVASGNIVYAGAMTSDDSSVVQGDNPFTYAQALAMDRKLVELNIPTFPNGRRPLFVTPLQSEQLSRDPEFQRLSTFIEQKNTLTAGYVKSFGNIDVYRSNTLTQKTNANGVKVHYAQMFGPGMVGVGPGEMPRPAVSTNDNYGETPLVVWLWYCALGVLDNRFGVSGRST